MFAGGITIREAQELMGSSYGPHDLADDETKSSVKLTIKHTHEERMSRSPLMGAYGGALTPIRLGRSRATRETNSSNTTPMTSTPVSPSNNSANTAPALNLDEQSSQRAAPEEQNKNEEKEPEAPTDPVENEEKVDEQVEKHVEQSHPQQGNESDEQLELRIHPPRGPPDADAPESGRSRSSSPPRGAYDVLKNQTEPGVLAHIFDLLTSVSPEEAASEEHRSQETEFINGTNFSSPIIAPALLPLTVLFSSTAEPQAVYHSDNGGHIRCTQWVAVDPRNVFEKMEQNVRTYRAGLTTKSHLAEVDELAAQLFTIDGTLPAQPLTLLQIGSLLKNGLHSLSHLSAYFETREGFIVQSFVFPSPSKSASFVPRHIVYRCEFSSASFFQCERRVNKYPIPAGPPATTYPLPCRINSFKSTCPPGTPPDRDSVLEVVSLKSLDPLQREVFGELRKICVNILKRVNEKCKVDDGQAKMIVQRLCLYFKYELGGPCHLLFGDRMDLRLVHIQSTYSHAERSKARANYLKERERERILRKSPIKNVQAQLAANKHQLSMLTTGANASPTTTSTKLPASPYAQPHSPIKPMKSLSLSDPYESPTSGRWD